jgi:nucleoside phosphorylase
MTTLSSPKLDIVVLGARTEEKNHLVQELDRVADQSESDKLRKRIKASHSVLPAFAIKDGTSTTDLFISVGVMECSDMGNVTAAINTAYVISEYEPNLLIFSGIAGSLEASRIRIGDVIFPRSIRTRYFQKLKRYNGNYASASLQDKAEVLEGVKGKLMTFDRTVEATMRGRQLLSHIANKRLDVLLETADIPADWLQHHRIANRPARVVDEEFSFSWDKVLSNKDYIDYIRPLIGNSCTVVDMESYGFLSAVHKLRSAVRGYTSEAVVIRAVSDFAEHKELSDQDARWRTLGLRNMAIATRYVIQEVYGRVF